jgi:hypothetical protein
MPKIDYNHSGVESDYEATTYTLMVYEQEFKSDLIKDVFGRIDLSRASNNIDADGNVIAMDYTIDNWNSYPRAFWAMLKTSEAISRGEGKSVKPVPPFIQWCLNDGRGINMSELSQTVIDECNRGLFLSGAADSE